MLFLALKITSEANRLVKPKLKWAQDMEDVTLLTHAMDLLCIFEVSPPGTVASYTA